MRERILVWKAMSSMSFAILVICWALALIRAISGVSVQISSISDQLAAAVRGQEIALAGMEERIRPEDPSDFRRRSKAMPSAEG